MVELKSFMAHSCKSIRPRHDPGYVSHVGHRNILVIPLSNFLFRNEKLPQAISATNPLTVQPYPPADRLLSPSGAIMAIPSPSSSRAPSSTRYTLENQTLPPPHVISVAQSDALLDAYENQLHAYDE